MDYTNHHNKIIDRARNRVLEGYTESHHVVPRCLGGTDDFENIVELTAREHYVIHQLLVKMYPNESGLVYAARMMTFTTKKVKRVNNRLYGWLKEKHANAVSENLLGKKQSSSHIERRAEALKGNQNCKGHKNAHKTIFIKGAQYSSVNEAAYSLGVCTNTIRRWKKKEKVS